MASETEQDRKRNPDGTFASSEKKMESVELSGGIEEKEIYEESLDRPGLTEDEGAGRLEELLAEAEGVEPEDIETLSADARQELKDRAEDSGEIRDAARYLEEQLKAKEAEEQAEGEPSREPVPFNQLSEELGVSEDDVLVTVKVQGEESEIPLSEAIKGYQLESTATRKFQELAEKRKEVEKLEEDHAQALEMIATTLGQHLDPKTQEAVVNEYNAILSNVAQRNQAAMQEQAVESREKLRESFDWTEDAEWDAARTAMRNYAEREYGWTAEDMATVTDHRMYEILEKARRYDMEVKGKKPSPTLKPGQGSRNPARLSNPERQVREARKRLRATGSVDDAATAIEGILGDDL